MTTDPPVIVDALYHLVESMRLASDDDLDSCAGPSHQMIRVDVMWRVLCIARSLVPLDVNADGLFRRVDLADLRLAAVQVQRERRAL